MKLYFLLASCILFACSGWARAAEIVLHENSAGQRILIRRGDMVVVKLPSNRTTGYSWSAVLSSPDRLLQRGSPVYLSARDRRLVGAGGLEIWRFRAFHTGQTKLIFKYRRLWEKGIPPVCTLSWFILVRP